MKIKTLIASRDTKLRQALEFLLNTEPKAQITGSTSNSAGLLALVQATSPDLVLLDWGLPDKPGGDLVSDLLRISPATKTMVFSGPDAEAEALLAGADICIVKGSSPDVILEKFHGLYRV